jgi:hypothetical protein
MHITLVLLAAAGQVVTALDPHVTHLPRAANQEDNLATITTLVDGHLPTCFTGHPTHPCPTNGPGAKRDMVEDLAGNPVSGLAGNPMGGLPGGINEVARIVPIEQIGLTASGEPSSPTDAPKTKAAPRDASMGTWDKDYVPHPSEWAMPGSFKFTDSIDHNSTGHKYNGHHSAGHEHTGHNPTAQKYTAHEPVAQKYSGHNSTAQKYADHEPVAQKYSGYNSTAQKYSAQEPVAHKHTGYEAIAHKHIGHKHTGYDSTARKQTGYNSTAYKYTGYNSTGTTPSPVNLNTSSIEKYYVAPTAVVPQSNNHYARYHNKVHHDNLGQGNSYNHTSAGNSYNHTSAGDSYNHTSTISESVTAKAYSQTTAPPVLPSTSHTSVANSSKDAQVAASIGTLLSAAMYPGMMRKPDANSTKQVQASVSTSCTSSEASSSSSSMPKPVTMATSPRPSEAQPTASYKAAGQPAQYQQTARHFVS